MNKLIILLIILSFIWGCNSQEIYIENDVNLEYLSNDNGKFRKEVSVVDNSGKNTVFLAVSCDNEDILNNYLENVSFELATFRNAISNELSKDLLTKEEQIDKEEQFDIQGNANIKINTEALNNIVNIELLMTNFEKDVINYTIREKSLNLKSFIPDWTYATLWETTGSFIGVVHDLTGSEFTCTASYKNNWYSLGWSQVEVDGVVNWFVYPQIGLHYFYLKHSSSWEPHKMRIGLIPHINQSYVQNYEIVFSVDEFLNPYCPNSIGTYQHFGKCFVGVAPTGTTAFIYAYQSNPSVRYFFHTPVNGNQCPIAGSSFDGANCRVMEIPTDRNAWIYNNKWYMDSGKLFN